MKRNRSHNRDTHSLRYRLIAVLALLFLHACCSLAVAAKVLIIGDLRYALVADVAADIRSAVRAQVKEYAITDIKGRLETLVEREGAQTVVALGVEAVAEALRLPPAVSVVFGLVVLPPESTRRRLTGVYMSPPAAEYISTVRRYFPSIGRISVVGSPAMVRFLAAGQHYQVTTHEVGISTELVNAVNRMECHALLLLPDVNLLTASAMENIYAFSFRKGVSLLGVSEANVKHGSLLALVFDPKSVSWQIAEMVQEILQGGDAGEIPRSPPDKYNLFVNTNTAKKMGLAIPVELLQKAKKTYP